MCPAGNGGKTQTSEGKICIFFAGRGPTRKPGLKGFEISPEGAGSGPVVPRGVWNITGRVGSGRPDPTQSDPR